MQPPLSPIEGPTTKEEVREDLGDLKQTLLGCKDPDGHGTVHLCRVFKACELTARSLNYVGVHSLTKSQPCSGASPSLHQAAKKPQPVLFADN